jgi:predicted metal-dependent hydrolase
MSIALFRRPLAEPEHLDIRHGDLRFRVALRRLPTARRITLRVSSATGEVVLTLPERADLASAQRFAGAHAAWIATRLDRMPVRTPFAPQARVPVRGVPHRIVHWSTAGGVTRAVYGPDGESIIAVACADAHVARRVREFLGREARRDLGEAVRRHSEKLGLSAKRIAVRDTRSRWGSCSAGGHLSFSWRLVMAPPFVLDYLAAHEVAHLKELNHSHRFWRVVRDLCPGTDEAEGWLKRHGAELYRYG